MRELLSLYLHIPFCLQKCRYCDFLSGPQDAQTREQYVQALVREIRWQASRRPDTPVDTVFFGGGTPSVLTAGELSGLMEALHAHYRIRPDAEISLEMNPGTADLEKLLALRGMGFNRLSIGVQSMHDGELRLLGRIHTARQAREAYSLARRAGFDTINIDLMSALPGQSLHSWQESLEEAAAWDPEHISAYSLILEPGTPFFTMHEKGELPPLPDEDTDREMYHYTGRFLAGHGYAQYEISNYAKPGRECRHNIGYWTGHPYLGFGIGAASCVDGTRFSNIPDLEDYLRAMGPDAPGPQGAAPQAGIHPLTVEEQMEEFMFLGLRMTEGVRFRDFESRFRKKMEDVYAEVIKKHLAQGVLVRTRDGVRLTDRGVDVSNYVLADYLLEGVLI